MDKATEFQCGEQEVEGRGSRKGQLEPQDISPHSCQTQKWRSWSLKLVSEPLPGSANAERKYGGTDEDDTMNK